MDFLNAFVALSNFVLIPAISYGSQLALGALGVTLIYGILRFSNFAHGDTMAFGAMATILFTWLFQSWGISLGVLPTALLALPFGILCTIGLLLATDRPSEAARTLRSAPQAEDPRWMDLQAALLADAGRKREAISLGRRALLLASSGGSESVTAEIRAHLEEYKAGRSALPAWIQKENRAPN